MKQNEKLDEGDLLQRKTPSHNSVTEMRGFEDDGEVGGVLNLKTLNPSGGRRASFCLPRDTKKNPNNSSAASQFVSEVLMAAAGRLPVRVTTSNSNVTPAAVNQTILGEMAVVLSNGHRRERAALVHLEPTQQ